MGIFSDIFGSVKGDTRKRARDLTVKDASENDQTQLDNDTDECMSLESFLSARSNLSSENDERTADQFRDKDDAKIAQREPAQCHEILVSHDDFLHHANRSTPPGLQPRCSMQSIRRKLRLPADIFVSPGPTKDGENDCPIPTSDQRSYNSYGYEQDDEPEGYDASYSIRTPDITSGTTLTAVGAFVAAADNMRIQATALVTRDQRSPANAGMRTPLAFKTGANKSKVSPLPPNFQSSISTIRSPSESLSMTEIRRILQNCAHNDRNVIGDSPASSSSSSESDDDNHSPLCRRHGGFSFDPLALPPYQMMETPDAPRYPKTKSRLSTAECMSSLQMNDMGASTSLVYQNSKQYSSMIMTSPASLISYGGIDRNCSDDEDAQRLRLLTPGRSSSGRKLKKITIHHSHSSLVMTSPSKGTTHPYRASRGVVTTSTARYLETSFERTLHKSSSRFAEPRAEIKEQARIIQKTQNPRRHRSNGVGNTGYVSSAVRFNKGRGISRGQANSDEDDRRLFASPLSFDADIDDEDYNCHELISISSSRRQLPYDFNRIDGCVVDSDEFDWSFRPDTTGTIPKNVREADFDFDPSFHDVSDISISQSHPNNVHRMPIIDYRMPFSPDGGEVCMSDIGDSEKKNIHLVVAEKSQQGQAMVSGETLLQRKRQNQRKAKEMLLRGMIRRLQGNPELVVDIEAHSDDFYERCPRYVQSSSSDGPLFVKTRMKEEGIIPGYSSTTRDEILCKLDSIFHTVYESDSSFSTDLRDALNFATSLVENAKEEHDIIPFYEESGISRRILGIDVGESPGFTAPTASSADANLSLASTISSKATFVRNSELSNGVAIRRTILITCSLLQKMTFAFQGLINADGENDFSAKDIKHCYLQLMNLASKDIHDVDSAFSVSVEDRTSKSDGSVSRQHAVAKGTKDRAHFWQSPVQPEPQFSDVNTCSDDFCNGDRKADPSKDEAWMKRYDATNGDTLDRDVERQEETSDEKDTTYDTSWMRKYEAVMDNILRAQHERAQFDPVESTATDHPFTGDNFPAQMETETLNDNTDNDENERGFTVALENPAPTMNIVAKKSKNAFSRYSSNSAPERTRKRKKGRNRTVLGAV